MKLDLSAYLEQVLGIAERAGDIISQIYEQQTINIQIKADDTPVTDADLAAHHYICAQLKQLVDWPIVSEEACESQGLIPQEFYWLVDPLDGTKEFIERSGEFTVNIALIHQGSPILGVVYAPTFNTLYYAVQHGGAFKKLKHGPAEPICTRAFDREQFLYVVSRRHSSECLESFQRKWPGCRVERVGSSLKFCLIAEGKADLYIRRGPTNEWDTAAAQCILEEAGGKVMALQDHRLRYNKGQLRNPEFIAFGDKTCQVSWFL